MDINDTGQKIIRLILPLGDSLSLIRNSKWWRRAEFLSSPVLNYESGRDGDDSATKMCERIPPSVFVEPSADVDTLNRFSSFSKLIRVVAYCNRFGRKKGF